MKYSKVIRSFLLILLISLFSSPAYAVTQMGIDEKGARYFKCGFTCGKFKVIRRTRNTYRIFSINFSGEIKAGSFQEAAEFACRVSDDAMRKLTNPLPSRSGSNC
jgi:hypothetical protein